jgi:Oligonucleotide/oligosaccharide-binding (OB)-fold
LFCFQSQGAKEKEGEAQKLKLYVRTDGPDDENNSATSAAARDGNNRGRHSNEERVFIHPSSANFSTVTFSCPWLVYHSLVRTSKAFLRDVTECNTYTLLLFGGKLDAVAFEGVVTLDNWCQLAASGKICSLVNGLRGKVVSAVLDDIAVLQQSLTFTHPLYL